MLPSGKWRSLELALAARLLSWMFRRIFCNTIQNLKKNERGRALYDELREYQRTCFLEAEDEDYKDRIPRDFNFVERNVRKHFSHGTKLPGGNLYLK